MSEPTENPDRLTSLKRALVALKDARSRLEAFERARSEPIAVIGIGCRFPGGSTDPEAFWRVLRDGVDTVSEIPPGRWDVDAFYDPDPIAPGKAYTRFGAFIDHPDLFDAGFFGLSPREAAAMDPQQRLLLEVSWEALEHAGIAPDRLTNSRTGVFVGLMSSDYLHLGSNLSDPEAIDAYSGTGVAYCVAAGRISYVLGLQGPSIAVDTACSSSLVAIHLACQSLRNRECNLALAGGVNLILSPYTYLVTSKLRALAANGRCKTFDASADGYGRGEGCGVLVLKRLSEALTNGDRVLALIRGSAVNHDGPSGGFTVPNALAQQSLIRDALANAGVKPSEVSYVEAHGTGTMLGDPIELRALSSVLGSGRREQDRIAVGSVKANIGHTEGAAGAAGVIKVVLSLQHGEIPPHLHLRNPNPHIAWEELPVVIPREPSSWPRINGRRIAGVSSFGLSGTNAHVILEEAPAIEAGQSTLKRTFHLLSLSAKSEEALRELAERFKNYLAACPKEELPDICHTTNAGRTHFPHRLAVVGDSSGLIHERLTEFLQGREASGWVTGKRVLAAAERKVAFLFSGQGSQYVGMGRELFESEPVFRKTLERCDAIVQDLLGRSILSEIYPQAGESFLDQTAFTQPALFAVEYALTEFWRGLGIVPAAVMGHSLGEYAAACAAGAMSLEDGLSLVVERGRLMQALPQEGLMLAVNADAARVAGEMQNVAEHVSIAAVNGPENTVVSGIREEVEKLARRFEEQGVRTKQLEISHASHSPLIEPALDAFEEKVSKVTFASPGIRLISNLTGRPVTSEELSMPQYWRRHLREAVQFAAGMQYLSDQGFRVFLELGPSPTLVGMGKQCLPQPGLLWLPSLRKGRGDWEQILESVSALYVAGTEVDWENLNDGKSRRKVVLPTYPFQRRRYWLSPSVPARQAARDGAGTTGHPLLGRKIESPLREIQFESELSLERLPYLGDHRIDGRAVLPAAAYLEMALAAAPEVLGSGQCALENVVIHAAMFLSEDDSRRVQLILTPEGGDAAEFQVSSLSIQDDQPTESAWRLHASGRMRKTAPELAAGTLQVDLKTIQSRCRQEESPDGIYLTVEERGLVYGESFRGIRRIWRNHGEVFGLVRLTEKAIPSTEDYFFHPALLDSCLQIIGAFVDWGKVGDEQVYLPVGLERMLFEGAPGRELWCHAVLRANEPGDQTTCVADLRFFDKAGTVKGEVFGLCARRVSRDALPGGRRKAVSDWICEPKWRKQARSAYPAVVAGRPDPSTVQNMTAAPGKEDSTTDWIIFGDRGGIGEELAQHLRVLGVSSSLVYAAEENRGGAEERHFLNPGRLEEIQRYLQQDQSEGHPASRVIIYLWALDAREQGDVKAEDIDAAQARACGGLLHLVQAVKGTYSDRAVRLYMVTSGGQCVDPKDAPPSVVQGTLWGLGRVIALEHPEIWGGMIDLDPGAQPDMSELVQQVLHSEGEDHVAYRNGERHVARLLPSRVDIGRQGRMDLREDATYLITGGLGGLGIQAARWMSDRGARHIVLLSHGVPSAAAAETIDELRSGDTEVVVVQADVSVEADVSRVISDIGRSMPPLRGIIHAAGVLADGILLRQDWGRFALVMAPKVRGSWILHRLTAAMQLDFFVLFSSAASLVGSPGQGNHAAACAFLDSLAHHRRQAGMCGLSINWGAWGGVGTVARPGVDRRVTEQGVVIMSPDEGLAALEMLMSNERAQAGVLPLDWGKLSRGFRDGKVPPLLSELRRGRKTRREDDATPALTKSRLLAVPEREREAILIEYLSLQAARVLRLPADQLERDRSLTHAGFDSLMALELKSRLERDLQMELSLNDLFGGPSIRELATHLLDGLAAEAVLGTMQGVHGETEGEDGWEILRL